MLHEWLEWRDALARFMNEHRILCQASTPDPVAISGARWRISQASRQRTNWLAGVVHPLAERLAHTPGGAAWLALQADMPVYRQRISQFISHWPIEAIVDDWDRYRRVIPELRAEVAAWLRNEEFAIRALAAELEAEASTEGVMARQA